MSGMKRVTTNGTPPASSWNVALRFASIGASRRKRNVLMALALTSGFTTTSSVPSRSNHVAADAQDRSSYNAGTTLTPRCVKSRKYSLFAFHSINANGFANSSRCEAFDANTLSRSRNASQSLV